MARVIFRCDASDTISGGHVGRCMALARELKGRGARVELVTRGLPRETRELLVAPAGVTVHDLPEPSGATRGPTDEGAPLAHADWLGVPQHLDAAQTAAVLAGGERAEWLVVDHYALDARWERAVRTHVERVLVIDDLADRDHACDALLDQNFHLDGSARYEGRVPRGAELMLGPRYALLRAEFAEAHERLRERDGSLRRILVAFGGFDETRQTVRALEALEAAQLSDVHVDVAISAAHAQRTAIEAWCARHPESELHVATPRIAELMARADLTLGAGGTMNWERACLGVPTIIASVADNQHAVARDLAAHCACIYLGTADEWRPEALAALLRGLAATPHLLRALGLRNAALTDGRGARRVAQRLLPSAVRLRRAARGDCAAVHAWRNADEARRHSADTRAIPFDEHERWFERMLADRATALLIGEDSDGPVGVLRYDARGEEATVSVYLVPEKSGRGLGTALLRAGTRWMREHYPRVARLTAAIRPDNARSLAAFRNAGYRLEMQHCILDVRHD